MCLIIHIVILAKAIAPKVEKVDQYMCTLLMQPLHLTLLKKTFGPFAPGASMLHKTYY